MQRALRPYVTTGIAIVGASVLVAAPISVTPQALQPPALNVAIDDMASVTDFIQGLLMDFNTATVAGGAAAQITIDTPLRDCRSDSRLQPRRSSIIRRQLPTSSTT